MYTFKVNVVVQFYPWFKFYFTSLIIIAELPRVPKAPAGGASIGIEINKPMKARKFGCRLRTYVRTD